MNISKQYSEDAGINKYNSNRNFINNLEDNNDIPSHRIQKEESDNNPTFLRRNFTFISMLLMILFAVIINHYGFTKLFQEYLNIDINNYMIISYFNITDLIKNEQPEKEDIALNFKKKYIYPYFWELLFTFLILFILGFYLFIQYIKEEQNISIQNELSMEDQIRSDPYLIRQSNSEYEQMKDYYTKLELEKLYNSDKFKKMMQEKGNNIINWNWQIREKYAKDVYREKGTESEDISHLSLSD